MSYFEFHIQLRELNSKVPVTFVDNSFVDSHTECFLMRQCIWTPWKQSPLVSLRMSPNPSIRKNLWGISENIYTGEKTLSFSPSLSTSPLWKKSKTYTINLKNKASMKTKMVWTHSTNDGLRPGDPYYNTFVWCRRLGIPGEIPCSQWMWAQNWWTLRNRSSPAKASRQLPRQHLLSLNTVEIHSALGAKRKHT
jgi:hypothetical protein